MTRLWACLRCVLFLVLLTLVTIALVWGAMHIPQVARSVHSLKDAGGLTPFGVLSGELIQLIAVCVVSAVMVYGQAFFQKGSAGQRPFLRTLFLHDSVWLRKGVSGMGWGALWASAIIMVIVLCQGYQTHLALSSVGQALLSLLAYGLTFLVVGATEELMFRGYLYAQLGKAFGWGWASVITSVLFGLIHIPSGTPLWGAIGAGLAGYVFCYMLRVTGSLFYPIGFHAAWDWAQTAVFGVNDSGHAAHDALFHTDIHGPYWLTGGSDGPEASVVCFMVYGLLVFYFHRQLHKNSGFIL